MPNGRPVAALALGLLLDLAGSLRADEQLLGRLLKPEKGIERLAISPDSRWLIGGCKEDTRLWPLKGDDPLAKCVVLRGPAGPVSHDGVWLMTADEDRVLRLWDLKANDPSLKGVELARYDASWKSLRGVAFSPDDRWLVTVGGDRVLRLWDLKDREGKAQPRALVERQEGHLILTPDGRWLTTGSASGRVGVWDLEADDPLATGVVRQFRENRYAGPAGLSPDGRWLVAGALSYPERQLWDLRAKDPWAADARLGTTEWVRALDFSRDGRWLATGGDDGQTRLYDLKTTDPASKPLELGGSARSESVRELAFSPNGRWLATRASDKTARLWDLKTSRK